MQSWCGGLDSRMDNDEFLKNKLVCNWSFGGLLFALNRLQHISHWEKRTKFSFLKKHLSWGPRVLFGFYFSISQMQASFCRKNTFQTGKKNNFTTEKTLVTTQKTHFTLEQTKFTMGKNTFHTGRYKFTMGKNTFHTGKNKIYNGKKHISHWVFFRGLKLWGLCENFD